MYIVFDILQYNGVNKEYYIKITIKIAHTKNGTHM